MRPKISYSYGSPCIVRMIPEVIARPYPPESLPATMTTIPEFSHLTVALVISLALSFLFARRKSMVTSSKRSADG